MEISKKSLICRFASWGKTSNSKIENGCDLIIGVACGALNVASMTAIFVGLIFCAGVFSVHFQGPPAYTLSIIDIFVQGIAPLAIIAAVGGALYKFVPKICHRIKIT